MAREKRRTATSIVKCSKLVRSRWGRAMICGLAAVMVATISEVPRQPVEAAPPPPVDEVLERPDQMAALITARMTGKQVRITGMTTESAEYVAHPNGQIESKVYAGQVRMRQDDKWVEIDLTLQPAADGSVRAKAHPLDLWISGARKENGDLAAVGTGDRRLVLGWPGKLPTPVLSENRATYPEVAAGIDLVVEATRTGFSQYLTLKSRAAVEHLPALDLPLSGKALSSFTQGTAGELTLKDAADKPVAVVPAPEMWDARREEGTERPLRRALVKARSERRQPERGARANGLVMRLAPDLGWLKHPATKYPVTIDPQINALYTSFDTYVKEGDSVDRSGANDIQLGLLATTPAVKARGFVHWPVSALAGKQITAATVYFWNWWSHSCTASSWEIWTTGAASSATRWGTQPTWIQKEATSTETKGYSTACDDGWVSIDGASFFQRAANAGQATAYMGVRGTDESSTNSFKQFRSRNASSSSQVPYATVIYNSYPTVAMRSTVPATSCVTGSSRPTVNTATPQLRSVITDAEASSTTAEFEWWTLNGSTKLGSMVTSTAASGSTFSAAVPPGALHHDNSYKWRVRGNDGIVNGSWSSFCEFTVDTSIGSPPVVTSTTYPENAWGGDAGVGGEFTFEANGVTDAAAYEYSLDVQPPNKVVNTSEPGGSATVTITPSTPGWHTVWVRTRDSAGNVTELRNYPFKVGSAALTSPKIGDITGAKTVLSSIGTQSFTEVTYQWRRASSDSWVAIPSSDVTYAVGGDPVAWPVPATGGTVPNLNWDVAATLAAVDSEGIPRDGPLQVRAYFNPNSHGAPSDRVKIRFDRDRASADVADVGPGSVNLITGNYQLSTSDVSVVGLSVARTLNSRQPSGNADPLFGPGWTSGIVVSDAQATYTRLTAYGSLVQVKLPDNSTIGFTEANAAGVNYEPQVGAESYTLTFAASTNTFTLSDGDGNVVTFTRTATDPPNTYTPTAATVPGSGAATTYSWEKVTLGAREVMRPTRLLAPVPDGITCTTLVRGCRALTFTYATATTATGTADGTWGDYADRVKEISYTAWDPDLQTPAMRTIALARYTYDSTGRLRAHSDPRLDYEDNGSTKQLRTVYYYNGDGIITSLTPPAQEPWQFSYTTVPNDPGKGRLHKVTRSALSAGTAVETVVYQVPTSETGAPYDLSAAEAERWGQSEPPTDATAVFPPTQVPNGNPAIGDLPSSYERATVTYLDANARQVNLADPGGHVSATWYDHWGNIVRTLTAGNRARALGASSTDDATAEATKAHRHSTLHLHSADGQRLVSMLEPEHEVMLPTGGTARGRRTTSYTYDEDAPAAEEPYNLVTRQKVAVRLQDGSGAESEIDVRTTTISYDWGLRQPTTVTVDPDGLAHTTRTAFDPDTGLVTSTTDPAGGTSETTPATQKTIYYRAGSGSGYSECDLKPEWADLPCRTQPGGQPAAGPELPVTVTTYDMLDQPRVVTEKTSAGTLRTTTTKYDKAGRAYEKSVTAGPGLGTPVPVQREVYALDTGAHSRTQSVVNGSVVTEVVRLFDTLGRITSYTDADNNASVFSYDVVGRVVSSHDGKAQRTYSYDEDTERRGLLTSVDDTQAGRFSSTYDADGNTTSEVWPNGVTVNIEFNEIGDRVGLVYDKPNCSSEDCVLYTESAVRSVHGQRLVGISSFSQQRFEYDQAGRLAVVEDMVGGQCATRRYELSASSNWNSLAEYGSSPDGSCHRGAALTTRTWAHDTADRVTNTGYDYDLLGRTISLPGVDTANPAGGDVTFTYHATDLVDTITQNGRTTDYTLDVTGERIRSWTEYVNGTAEQRIHHYSGDQDSPSWTQETATRFTRPVSSVTGLAAIFDSGDTLDWQISNLHGDLVAGIKHGDDGASWTSESTEYGLPRNTASVKRYHWLGSAQRAADAPAGIMLMGVRLYNPTTGRFLQVDPVYGGSCNRYEYTCADPINQTDLSGKALPGVVAVLVALARGAYYACRISKSWCKRALKYLVTRAGRYLWRAYWWAVGKAKVYSSNERVKRGLDCGRALYTAVSNVRYGGYRSKAIAFTAGFVFGAVTRWRCFPRGKYS